MKLASLRRAAARSLLGLAVCGAALLAASAEAPQPHPISLDDMMKAEFFGRVEIGGHGRFVLYEKGGPNEGFHDFGIDDRAAQGRIYIFDREAKNAAPRRLLPGFAHPNWIAALSPDKSKLAIYWFENELVHAGVVDLASGKLTKFGVNPTYDFEQTLPVWISDDALIYSTVPDGQQSPRIAFRRSAALSMYEGWKRAWAGGSSVTVLEGRGQPFTPEWREGALMRVDAKTGHAVKLADGRYEELALSPDRRYLAASRQGRTMRVQPDAALSVYNYHRLEPMLIDVTKPSAPVRMCDACQLSGYSEFTWSPTGDRVSYFARFGDEHWEQARFRVFDAASGKLSEVRHTGLDMASQREIGQQNSPIDAIPFGDGALVPARRQSDPNAAPIFTYKESTSVPSLGLKTAGADALPRLDWYFIEPGAAPRAITAALPAVQTSIAASDSDGIYFLGGAKAIRIGLDGVVHEVASVDGAIMAYKRDDSGRAIAISRGATGMAVTFFKGETLEKSVPVAPTLGMPNASDPGAGVQVLLANSGQGSALTTVDAQGRVQTVAAINTHFKYILPAKQVILKYKLASGEDAQATLLLPADAVPGKKLPMIYWAYPSSGRYLAFWQYGIGSPYDPELFTSMGYALLMAYTPGSKLREGNNPVANWGALVTPAVDAAIAQGYVDKDRLGAYGMSLGGHSVLSLLSQTTYFKAGVAEHGVANFVSNYGSLGIVRHILPDDLFSVGHATQYESGPEQGLDVGGPPWEHVADYAAASPVNHAGQMNTPLMLINSDLDWNFPMSDFDQYFTALQRQGKEVVYVRYWGEGHGNVSPANVRDTWSRLRQWYGDHLK